MIVLATELPGLQKGLLTTSLTGTQWLACFGLAALLPLVIEIGQVDPPPTRSGADHDRRAARARPLTEPRTEGTS